MVAEAAILIVEQIRILGGGKSSNIDGGKDDSDKVEAEAAILMVVRMILSKWMQRQQY